MNIAPFATDRELIVFARSFFRDRVGSFRKDVAICLTANRDRHHAYFPGLITCIGFVDLLSGLHAGRLEGHGLQELKQYASRFLNATNYSSLNLEVLYLAFRHKLALLSVPYVVFDITNRKEYTGQKQRRITWSVHASRRKLAIEVLDLSPQQFLRKTLRPWPVHYNCRAVISVSTFQSDIIKSIYGPMGYLRFLETDPSARERFAKCMKMIFPP
jgi:hypothetical protein